MDTLNVTVPISWEFASQDELRFIYAMMALYSDRVDAWKAVAIRLALRSVGARFVSPHGDGFIFDIQGQECKFYSADMLPLLEHLQWLAVFPSNPVRLDTIDNGHAMEPDPTQELTFAQWMTLENLYQGYHYTHDSALLTEMARILYRNPYIVPLFGEQISVLFWWASVKMMVSLRFPDFFKPAPVSSDMEMPDADELRSSMDAQIRALTKGDITKEEQVLSLPADRALTELNALAREYAELNRKYPSSSNA